MSSKNRPLEVVVNGKAFDKKVRSCGGNARDGRRLWMHLVNKTKKATHTLTSAFPEHLTDEQLARIVQAGPGQFPYRRTGDWELITKALRGIGPSA